MPDFKVANAVIHFDEASPHMHGSSNIERHKERVIKEGVKAKCIYASNPVGCRIARYATGNKKLVLEIADEELKQKSLFLELLDVVKKIIQSYLPLQADIEEFANTVERGENITAGNSFRSFLLTLGQLLLTFKEIVQEGFCWLPRLM